ncbi:MAG: DUF1566 domain-containing protein [Leptospiraceae bacterium]|nr:DUF1566 domain-containing protein [Leptospiraceae bacterium]MBL0263441.1 DUF1566 domain-containing protein [Leptospiraceae bacterium]
MKTILLVIINAIILHCKAEVRLDSYKARPLGVLEKKENLYWQQCHYGDVNQETCERVESYKIYDYCYKSFGKGHRFQDCLYGLYNALSWKEAKYYCESFGDGWRLPTDMESLSLFDYSRLKAELKIPIYKEYFPVRTQEKIRNEESFTKIKNKEENAEEKGLGYFVTYRSAYWTSSLSPSNSSEAWVIDFDTGMLSLKNIASDRDRYLVKCVRNAN